MEKKAFEGRSVAVTGKLGHFTRREANAKISSLGGKPKSAVTKDTDYLICGEKPGSKLEKAHALGIKVIPETVFLDMLA